MSVLVVKIVGHVCFHLLLDKIDSTKSNGFLNNVGKTIKKIV